MFSEVNYLAIIVGGIINMIVGFMWYGPMLFGKKWEALSRVKMSDMKNKEIPKAYGTMFVSALVFSFVLAQVILLWNAETLIEGAKVGFIVWLGFSATSKISEVLFAKKPLQLFYIDAGYTLVTYILVGGMLTMWK